MKDQPDFLEPDPEQSPAERADEQFVHGLLEFLEKDSTAIQQERIRRTMAQIQIPETENSVSSKRVSWSLLAGLAASIAIVLGILHYVPAEPDAQQLLSAAVAATQNAENLRYRIHAEHNDGHAQPALKGEISILQNQHVVAQTQTQTGQDLTWGSDAKGPWIIQPDGQVERFSAPQVWPKQLQLEGSPVLLDSVDDVLKHIQHNYEPVLAHKTSTKATTGGELHHIIAHSREHNAEEPERIDVWLDPKSHLVHRLEIHWMAPSDGVDELHWMDPHSSHFLHNLHGHLQELHKTIFHKLFFELVGQPAFHPEWFDPETHSNH